MNETIVVNSKELWAARVLGLLLAIASLMTIAMYTNLRITNPGHVLAKVNAVEDKVLSRDEVEAIVKGSAPWLNDKQNVEGYITELRVQVKDLQRQIDELREKK